MANTHADLSSLFTNIANAIRNITGGTATIVADKFPETIDNLETGLGTADGDIFASKTVTSINKEWSKTTTGVTSTHSAFNGFSNVFTRVKVKMTLPTTHTTLSSLLSNIAEAIRGKTGKTAAVVADTFPTEIGSIKTDMGAQIGDVVASNTLTSINSDWIKADGTADVYESRYPTLFSKLGLNENRFRVRTYYTDTYHTGKFYGGCYDPDNNRFVLVGIHDNAGTYGDRFGYKILDIANKKAYSPYNHYSSYACNGLSDVVCCNGYYVASVLRNPTNTATTNGLAVTVFQFINNSISSAYAHSASNRNMTCAAAVDNYAMTAGVKVDGTLTVCINNTAGSLTSSWSTWNMTNMTNSNGTNEILDAVGYNNQFLVVSKLARNMFVLTPNGTSAPTVNRTTSFSSYFTTFEGIDVVNGCAVAYGMYNGNAKIAFTTGSVTSWTYKVIGAFTPVNVMYANGRYYIGGYSGNKKYIASSTSLDGTWVVTEIDCVLDIFSDEIPYAFVVDSNGVIHYSSNINELDKYINTLEPVVKQPAVTVSGKSNVFVRARIGGIG